MQYTKYTLLAIALLATSALASDTNPGKNKAVERAEQIMAVIKNVSDFDDSAKAADIDALKLTAEEIAFLKAEVGDYNVENLSSVLVPVANKSNDDVNIQINGAQAGLDATGQINGAQEGPDATGQINGAQAGFGATDQNTGAAAGSGATDQNAGAQTGSGATDQNAGAQTGSDANAQNTIDNQVGTSNNAAAESSAFMTHLGAYKYYYIIGGLVLTIAGGAFIMTRKSAEEETDL